MSEYPWNDNKYMNRINRMVLLIILIFYESYKNVVEFSKNFNNFKNSIGNIIININNLDKLIRDKLRDKFKMINLDKLVEYEEFKIPLEECKRKNNESLELLKTLKSINIDTILILIDELIILNNKIQYYSDIDNLKILLTNLLDKINLFKYDMKYDMIYDDDDDINILTKKIKYMGLDGSEIKQLGGYKQKYLKYKKKYIKLKKYIII
jgi:hypothetical protein